MRVLRPTKAPREKSFFSMTIRNPMRRTLFKKYLVRHTILCAALRYSRKTTTMVTATQITPTQMHLLKLFSFDKSEKRALEIKEVLMHYFQERLDAESDRLWEEGILDQKRLEELRHKDLHTKQ